MARQQVHRSDRPRTVAEAHPDAQRLDVFVTRVHLFRKREWAQAAIDAAQVQINGLPARASHAVRVGDGIAVYRPNGDRAFWGTVIALPRTARPAAELADYVETASTPAE